MQRAGPGPRFCSFRRKSTNVTGISQRNMTGNVTRITQRNIAGQYAAGRAGPSILQFPSKINEHDWDYATQHDWERDLDYATQSRANNPSRCVTGITQRNIAFGMVRRTGTTFLVTCACSWPRGSSRHSKNHVFSLSLGQGSVSPPKTEMLSNLLGGYPVNHACTGSLQLGGTVARVCATQSATHDSA